MTRAAMKDSGLVGVYLDECLTTLLNVLKKTGFFVCKLMSMKEASFKLPFLTSVRTLDKG